MGFDDCAGDNVDVEFFREGAVGGEVLFVLGAKGDWVELVSMDSKGKLGVGDLLNLGSSGSPVWKGLLSIVLSKLKSCEKP